MRSAGFAGSFSSSTAWDNSVLSVRAMPLTVVSLSPFSRLDVISRRESARVRLPTPRSPSSGST